MQNPHLHDVEASEPNDHFVNSHADLRYYYMPYFLHNSSGLPVDAMQLADTYQASWGPFIKSDCVIMLQA